jgi:hypothetical protein
MSAKTALRPPPKPEQPVTPLQPSRKRGGPSWRQDKGPHGLSSAKACAIGLWWRQAGIGMRLGCGVSTTHARPQRVGVTAHTVTYGFKGTRLGASRGYVHEGGREAFPHLSLYFAAFV